MPKHRNSELRRLNAELVETVNNLVIIRDKHFAYQKLHDALLLSLTASNQAHELAVAHSPEQRERIEALIAGLRQELATAASHLARTRSWILNGEKHVDALVEQIEILRRRRGRQAETE